MDLVEQFFEKVIDMTGTKLPLTGRSMCRTTSIIDNNITEPIGDTADEIIKNVAEQATDAVEKRAIEQDDERISDNAAQIVLQVVYDKMTAPRNAEFQQAIIDAALKEE